MKIFPNLTQKSQKPENFFQKTPKIPIFGISWDLSDPNPRFFGVQTCENQVFSENNRNNHNQDLAIGPFANPYIIHLLYTLYTFAFR